MIITTHIIFDVHGNEFGHESVDTADPNFIAVLAKMAAGTLDLVASGWSSPSAHPVYVGKNKLQVLQAEAKRLNEPTVVAAFKL